MLCSHTEQFLSEVIKFDRRVTRGNRFDVGLYWL